MRTSFAKRHDLLFYRDGAVTFRYLDGLKASVFITVCNDAVETLDFLYHKRELLANITSAICEVDDDGDLLITTADAAEKIGLVL